MKKCVWVLLLISLSAGASGCVKQKVNPVVLKTPDEKALYDLMVARGRASNAQSMDLFRQIYTEDSPELRWIETEGIPMWRSNGMNFREPSLKKISVVGKDAAATYVLRGKNKGGHSFSYRVEVLYVKEGDDWKIESTGAH